MGDVKLIKNKEFVDEFDENVFIEDYADNHEHDNHLLDDEQPLQITCYSTHPLRLPGIFNEQQVEGRDIHHLSHLSESSSKNTNEDSQESNPQFKDVKNGEGEICPTQRNGNQTLKNSTNKRDEIEEAYERVSDDLRLQIRSDENTKTHNALGIVPRDATFASNQYHNFNNQNPFNYPQQRPYFQHPAHSQPITRQQYPPQPLLHATPQLFNHIASIPPYELSKSQPALKEEGGGREYHRQVIDDGQNSSRLDPSTSLPLFIQKQQQQLQQQGFKAIKRDPRFFSSLDAAAHQFSEQSALQQQVKHEEPTNIYIDGNPLDVSNMQVNQLKDHEINLSKQKVIDRLSDARKPIVIPTAPQPSYIPVTNGASSLTTSQINNAQFYQQPQANFMHMPPPPSYNPNSEQHWQQRYHNNLPPPPFYPPEFYDMIPQKQKVIEQFYQQHGHHPPPPPSQSTNPLNKTGPSSQFSDQNPYSQANSIQRMLQQQFANAGQMPLSFLQQQSNQANPMLAFHMQQQQQLHRQQQIEAASMQRSSTVAPQPPLHHIVIKEEQSAARDDNGHESDDDEGGEEIVDQIIKKHQLQPSYGSGIADNFINHAQFSIQSNMTPEISRHHHSVSLANSYGMQQQQQRLFPPAINQIPFSFQQASIINQESSAAAVAATAAAAATSLNSRSVAQNKKDAIPIILQKKVKAGCTEVEEEESDDDIDDEDMDDVDDDDEDDDCENGGEDGSRNKAAAASAIALTKAAAVDNADQNQNGKRKAKNETKNIPKNYAKAFLRFIIDKTRMKEMKRILASYDSCELQYEDIKKEAKVFKKNMNAIKDVRKIWQDDTSLRTKAITKFMRIASHQFLQKEAISYIFSSNKIKNSKSHIIYRHVMSLAMADPQKFNNIKSLYKNAYAE